MSVPAQRRTTARDAGDTGRIPEPFAAGDEHTAIYLAMIESPSVTRNELIRRGFDADYVDRAIPVFVRRGLARPLGENLWEALPPDIALPAFAARLEEYARAVRASAPAMARTYARNVVKQPDPSGYNRLSTLDEIALATQQCLATAESHVFALRNSSPYTRYLLELPTDFHATQVRNEHGHPLSSQVTLDTELLAHERVNEVIAARSSVNEQYRFAASLPFSAIANDRGRAVIDIYGPAGESLGLSISTPEAAGAIRKVAEWAWRLATPWQVGMTASAELGPRDQRILQLLASGTTDSIIARQLGVSQRTVERRVRDVMDRLGADTRFEAGVLAAKSGLI